MVAAVLFDHVPLFASRFLWISSTLAAVGSADQLLTVSIQHCPLSLKPLTIDKQFFFCFLESHKHRSAATENSFDSLVLVRHCEMRVLTTVALQVSDDADAADTRATLCNASPEYAQCAALCPMRRIVYEQKANKVST